MRACVFVAVAASLACGVSTRGEQGVRSETLTLSIVATNDRHGHLLERDGRGGVAAFGGYLTNLRRARAQDGGVLLVDAGDMFQGTVESNLGEGHAVVAAYNALGYQGAAIGNHEFDFGVAGPGVAPPGTSADLRGALKARAAEARFPFLAANLVDEATGHPVRWTNVRPSTIVDVAGVRIGLVGVMTLRALSATIATTTTGLRVSPLAAAILRESAALRAGGADFVVVLAHAGGRCARFDNPRDLSSCDPSTAEIVDVLRQLPSGTVEVIASGHTHAGMAHEIDGTIVMQAFSRGTAFSRADLTIDRRARRVIARRVFPPRDICLRVYEGTERCDAQAAGRGPLRPAEYEGHPVQPDPAVARVIGPAVDSARGHATERIGIVLETAIRVAPIGTESPLGNLFTDAMLEAVEGADVAINNTRGGLRADLPAGPLTLGRLYETFPFENRLVRIEVSGAELRRVIETQLREGRALPGVAGVRVTAQCNGPDLAITMVRTSGRAIRNTERVVIATTDFLATGGDRLLTPIMPPGGFRSDDDLPFVRDVVADWLARRGGRLRDVDLIDTVRPRWNYRGGLPLSCR